MIKGFIILLQFMTRIPVPVKVEYDEEKLGKSIKYFPLVGLIIGFFLFAVNFLAGKVIENRHITAVVVIMAEILITGLIHIDGLADTADGLFSYAGKEKMLEKERLEEKNAEKLTIDYIKDGEKIEENCRLLTMKEAKRYYESHLKYLRKIYSEEEKGNRVNLSENLKNLKENLIKRKKVDI